MRTYEGLKEILKENIGIRGSNIWWSVQWYL